MHARATDNILASIKTTTKIKVKIALSLLNYHALSMYAGIWCTIIDVTFTSGAIIAQWAFTSEIANLIL